MKKTKRGGGSTLLSYFQPIAANTTCAISNGCSREKEQHPKHSATPTRTRYNNANGKPRPKPRPQVTKQATTAPSVEGELVSPWLLTWAKMEGHPWWPAMVSPHPSTGEVWRRPGGRRREGEGGGEMVHVQFFGQPPTRGWVSIRYVCAYVRMHVCASCFAAI